MRNRLAIAAILVLSLAPRLAAETFYSDRTAFEAAAGAPLSTESFDLAIADASSITFADGTQSNGSNGLGDAINTVTGGAWSARIRTGAGVEGYLTITWTFPRATNAFGVDWSSISSSRGVTLTGNWDGTGNESVLLWDALGSTSGGFVGVIGTTTFTQITLTATGTGDNDFFGADELTIRGGADVFADGFESGTTGAWSSTVAS